MKFINDFGSVRRHILNGGVALLLALCLMNPYAVSHAAEAAYQPNWASLDKHPLPAWYDDAKLGIFIHWGVYSVPAWAPTGSYAEWYWIALREKDGPTWKHHAATYGERFQYQDFAPMFKAELFNPDQWADIFARSGARYIVLTSKHHEGFCLWPSAQSWNWNAVDIGPHRDLLGELTKSVRARGLKMGFYYSIYEWYHPYYLGGDVPRYVDEHMLPQFKDLVTRYQPSIVWPDGEWDHPSSTWKSEQFLAWLYNEAPNRAEIVVNDRWGKETRGKHGDFYTTEYSKEVGQGSGPAIAHKWEECRGIGASFGYNRNEALDDYATPEKLVRMLVDIVSKGGNLLLDIGPTADGRIPVIMQERLVQLGQWLKVNGEAIYATKPWRVQAEGDGVRYTSKGGKVFAIVYAWPGEKLTLKSPEPGKDASVRLLGDEAKLAWKAEGGAVVIQLPKNAPAGPAISPYAYVFELSGMK